VRRKVHYQPKSTDQCENSVEKDGIKEKSREVSGETSVSPGGSKIEKSIYTMGKEGEKIGIKLTARSLHQKKGGSHFP